MASRPILTVSAPSSHRLAGLGDSTPSNRPLSLVLVADFLSLLLYLAPFLIPLVGLFFLYWVIRLAVRHGIRDADRRRPN